MVHPEVNLLNNLILHSSQRGSLTSPPRPQNSVYMNGAAAVPTWLKRIEEVRGLAAAHAAALQQVDLDPQRDARDDQRRIRERRRARPAAPVRA